MNKVNELSKKITSKKAQIGIVGMGYVGKALADLATKKRFKTFGFEIREDRVKAINNEGNKYLIATSDMTLIRECDVVIICVQTPIDENKLPDLRVLESATRVVAKHLQKNQLIIGESSIATGTTRNIILPILKESGLEAGTDYFLGYSPERVDPGNKYFTLDEIPKVVSGFDANSLKLTAEFYGQIMKKVVPVSSIETAELTKMFENTFRLINISLVNEMKAYAGSWGIDMWEIVNAAATKPFGFLPHYPSPGAGGHCIPVDPYYIYDDAKKRGIRLRMIEEAGKINDEQSENVVKKALNIIQNKKPTDAYKSSDNRVQFSIPLYGQKGGKSLIQIGGILPTQRRKIQRRLPKWIQLSAKQNAPKVLLVGLAYKPNIDDVRESPAIRIWEKLEKAGCEVQYHDPFIKTFRNTTSKALTASTVNQCDAIVIVTNHSNIDYKKLAGFGKPILDTRNVYRNGFNNHNVYRI